MNTTVSELTTKGNKIVDSQGKLVVLKGVSIADPEHIVRKRAGKSLEQVVASAVKLGAKVIRIPVHKGLEEGWGVFADISGYDKNYLEPSIRLVTNHGAYAIIDLHIEDDFLPHKDNVRKFWEYISKKYGTQKNLLFEIFNEPIKPYSWEIWRREIAQPTVDLIREHSRNLIIVGSPHWSMYVRDALKDPIDSYNIAYTAHLYPGHDQKIWLENYEPLRKQFPLFVTEWGYEDYPEKLVQGDTKSFGSDLMKWLNDHQISWTAWLFDNTWSNSILDKNWQLRREASSMGPMLKSALAN